MTELADVFGGGSASAYGINDQGVVVGGASLPGGSRHAFIEYPGGPIEDLNNYIDPSLGWSLGQAYAINDRGQILVAANDAAGHDRTVLLTPTPEPPSLFISAGRRTGPRIDKYRASRTMRGALVLLRSTRCRFQLSGGSEDVSTSMDARCPGAALGNRGNAPRQEKGQFLRRVEKQYRQRTGYFRTLRGESVEPRNMLTAVVEVWNPAGDPNPEWTSNVTAHRAQDWLLLNANGTYSASYWINGTVAQFPAMGTSSASPAVVSVSSDGADAVFASEINFTGVTLENLLNSISTPSASYYSFQTADTNPTAGNDQLQVGQDGTSIETDQASASLPNVATFAVAIAQYGSGSSPNTVTIASGASGSTGTVVFTTPNTYSGGTYLAQGTTLNINSIGSLGTASTPLIFQGDATLQAAAPLTISQNVVVDCFPLNNSTYSYTATFDSDGQALDLTGTIASTSSAVGAAVSVVDGSTSHTGSFTIDADQTLGSLDATGGELNVAANVTVTGHADPTGVPRSRERGRKAAYHGNRRIALCV